ncbi:hypothetical protein Trydic_g10065, partial [Trypoxylus dichotomus]
MTEFFWQSCLRKNWVMLVRNTGRDFTMTSLLWGK